MKSAWFVLIVALLFVCARADDAKKLGFKCPLTTKYFKDEIDPTQFEKFCLPLGSTATSKVCDACFAFLVSSVGEDALKAMGLAKAYQFYILEASNGEKMRAIAEACGPRMQKAMKQKGLSSKKLNQALKYPNGKMFKCPLETAKYPATTAAATKLISDIAGPLLNGLGK